MKVYLLYPSKEWRNTDYYYDRKSIQTDLGLEVLFRTGSRDQSQQEGNVQTIVNSDSYLEETFRNIAMVPLKTKEEIVYRQEILKDCIHNPEFVRSFYNFAKETIWEWDKLGRKVGKKITDDDTTAGVMARAKLLKLFTERLIILKEMLGSLDGLLLSDGLKTFSKRVFEFFSDELQENIETVLEDISFFLEEAEVDKRNNKLKKRNVRMILECSMANGLKPDDLKVHFIETTNKKRKKLKHKMTFNKFYQGGFFTVPDGPLKENILLEETNKLEYKVVDYLISYCDFFVNECKEFFEQLYVQSAFYQSAYNLYVKMLRDQLPICFPTVGGQDTLSCSDLVELNMALYHTTIPVGNEVDIRQKMLCVITGANQGGKSTFLRSIGIAQIMMQCGLFVSAQYYESGIYPSFFTHFTRREDCEMNSGRLDEELRRMNDMVENMDQNTLILLNESFATTTEKEGSVIAYDIIKALVDNNVKVLTVTHLLSFAQRLYKESKSYVEFLSAERLDDGTRTYKMIQAEPELTSFGLDLYEQIIC